MTTDEKDLSVRKDGRAEKAPHLAWRRKGLAEIKRWRKAILATLADGKPCTFNRLCVRGADPVPVESRPSAETTAMSLFTIHLDFEHEAYAVPYDSVVAALHDPGLAVAIESATASVWSGDLKVTPDITTWEKLREQLVSNAATLLRRAVDHPPR